MAVRGALTSLLLAGVALTPDARHIKTSRLQNTVRLLLLLLLESFCNLLDNRTPSVRLVHGFSCPICTHMVVFEQS